MPDSFADLWSSTAPIHPTPQPRKLGDRAPSSVPQPRLPHNDTFSLLAAQNSNSGTRSNSPSMINGLPRNGTKSVNPTTNGDAFSGLLSPSFGGFGNSANMTMAERAAKVELERKELFLKQQEHMKAQAAAWSGLDSLGASSTYTTPSISSQQQGDINWGFDSSNPARQSQKPPLKPPQTPLTTDDDDWGLDLSDFVSGPTSSNSKPVATPQSLWDLEDIDRPPSASLVRAHQQAPRSISPGDFDFGDREDRLLDDDSGDEDNVLGVLAKPANSIPRRPSSNPNTASPPRADQVPRSVSPPPHIIGQIVEMGFSPQQARIALAATDTGVNVQAALEMLLGEGPSGSRSPAPERQGPCPSRGREREPMEEDDCRPQIRRSGGSGPSQEREVGATSVDMQKNIQDQADKLLAQASEIGLNMFTRANAFWSQGREKVQKVIEERKAAAGSNPSPAQNGRPKWMQNISEDQEDGGWRDENNHDDDGSPQNSKPPSNQQRQRPLPPEVQTQPQTKIGNLLDDEAPAVYRSPFRRGPSRSQPQPDQPPTSSSSGPASKRASSPIAVTRRHAVSASVHAVATSMKHKAVGTEMFKLGRFSEAETAYSSAIAALPESHLLLVQLYNNRALSRLKTGDHSGTIEDCSEVISLIGSSYHPAREAKVAREEEGSAVDLADGLTKAHRRRAEAYEGREKWDLARKDWEIIAGTEWASGKMRNDAVTGVDRCRRMATTDSPSSTKPTLPARTIPKRAPPTAIRRGPTPPSAALTKLRAANNAADAEDQAKYELKDTIDSKISSWKTGKENNIRALIASLETVLWPSLGWQKVGMHELVTPSQVKVRYTKAIAKLHPDKLNVNNTTLEQRMIANAVFGSLSDAWNAFKP